MNHNHLLPAPAHSMDEIREAVQEAYGFTRRQMLSRDRPARLAFARQVAMALCREEGYTLQSIGEHFGDRDHGTVIHAVKRVRDACKQEPRLKQMVEEIRNKIEETNTKKRSESALIECG